jgi:hypothetical protein
MHNFITLHLKNCKIPQKIMEGIGLFVNFSADFPKVPYIIGTFDVNNSFAIDSATFHCNCHVWHLRNSISCF